MIAVTANTTREVDSSHVPMLSNPVLVLGEPTVGPEKEGREPLTPAQNRELLHGPHYSRSASAGPGENRRAPDGGLICT